MLGLNWLPLRFIVRKVARAHGFLDPIALLSHLQRFTQPSEVAEPIELLRAGVVLHARGLINSRVIQHNLDWVWPFWVERQFDPGDDAFVPRAFSITHINLTHRNWTAVGLPDWPDLPIVDPRGLVTPHYDGWSLDSWVLADDGRRLLPSRAPHAVQRLLLEEGPCVVTETHDQDLALTSRVAVGMEGEHPVCRLRVRATAAGGGWVAIALRPYNPEGVSFVHRVRLGADGAHWTVDGAQRVGFDAPVERHRVSRYRDGDVLTGGEDGGKPGQEARCDVGMVTAAALFRIPPERAREVVVTVPLGATDASPKTFHKVSWKSALGGHCRLRVPDARMQFLYDAAIQTLVLHSPDDVYPGPYTYKRFWFRDAAFIINALLGAGLIDRAERALARFPERQTARGYFHSQDGEWDSNGQALWIMEHFSRVSGRPPKEAWWTCIARGARWITQKRLSGVSGVPHAGLLPAGFSAEHLGPNDYYYWDDFWGVAGLNAAARMADALGRGSSADGFRGDADAFMRDIDASLGGCAERLERPAMPASPYRRLDAGAIGSICAGYPLMLYPPGDERLLDLVAFLTSDCFVDGGFFQDMIHSGINAYLTLHVAQVLLRVGDSRYWDLMCRTAELASPTGQWPEAIHPRTGGGCMGDGQHVWAAAEWVLMVRNLFVREEGGGLVLASGIPDTWLEDGGPVTFGPAPTRFGSVQITVTPGEGNRVVAWEGKWWDGEPPITVHLPGSAPVNVVPGVSRVVIDGVGA